MYQRTTARKLGQWASGISLMLVALTATGLSLAINVSYGLKVNTATGVIFGLSDVALAIIPPVAVALGWSRHLRVAFLICAFVSVWTAANFMAEGQWTRFASIEHKADQRDDLKERVASLKNDLARIEEQGTVKSLAERVEIKAAQAKREGNRGYCGPKCEKLKTQEAQLRARLGLAQRRDALSADLAAARKKLASAKPPGLSQGKEIRMVVTVTIAIILLEVLRHLNGLASRMIRLAMRKPRQRKPKAEAAEPTAAPAPARPANVIPLPEERARKGFKSLAGV